MSRGFSRFFIVSVLAATLFPAFLPAQEPAAAPDKHASRRAIQKALAKQVDWKFSETPLAEAVQKLREELKIPILLDRNALEELGVSADTPVTLEIGGITAKSALNLILRELGLTTMIRDEVLLITSPDVADTNLHALPYDVTDLVLGEDGIEDVMFDVLIDLITKTVKPTTWDEVGGPGSIQPFESVGIISIVVAQTDEVHEELVDLLADLRALRKPGVKLPKTVPPVPGTPVEKAAPPALSVAETAARAAERKIRAALKKKVDWDFHETPLTDIVELIQKELHVKAVLNRKAMEELGVEPTSPVTLKISDISAMSALDIVLRELGLSFTIRDEVLLITSADEAENNLLTQTYDVSDLPAFRTKVGTTTPDYDQLIDTITKTIYPTTWDRVGGPATIQPLDAEGIQALVIGQTLPIHEKIADLLANLRKLRKTPLTKEELEKLPLPPNPKSESGLEATPRRASNPESYLPLKPDPVRESIVQANNRFAVDLYSKLRGNSEGNLFFSPYSLSTALSMAYAGASGETAEEMAKTLRYSLKQGEIPAGFQSLLKEVSPENDSTGRIFVANRLWCQSGFNYRKSFLETCRFQYFSEIGGIDFQKNPEAARKEINAWVEEKTRNKIKDLFAKNSIQNDCRMVITNAVYFKDVWQDKFDKKLTRADSFYSATGEIRVQMMNQQERCRYAEAESVQILEKPYSDGRLAMIFLLPKKEEGAFGKLEDSLSEEKFRGWISQLKTRKVEISLPRFRMDAQFDLGDTLQAMGMKLAFDQSRADFSGMHEETAWRLWIDLVVQKAFIEVDEEGTEAAAASGIGMGGFGGMMSKPKIPVFRADHPFLFLLRDTRTGCILFMGRVMQPPRERQAE